MLARELDRDLVVHTEPPAPPASKEPPGPSRAELDALREQDERTKRAAEKSKMARLANKTKGLDKIPGSATSDRGEAR